MSRLELKHITKVYPTGKVALDDVSLVIDERDFVAILGPSGCGKTTLLRIIAGLEEPDSGEIWMDGKRIDSLPPQERQVGMIFQNYALYPHMDVAGNLGFAMEIRRVKKKERRQIVESIAKKMQIKRYLKKLPERLSGGEKQRVAIGRALADDACVYLCDEPLANLDGNLRVSMRSELLNVYKNQQAPFVLTTHDWLDAMTLSTKTVVMKDGRIMQEAPAREIYNCPVNSFVGGFVGSPAMNFLNGKITASNEKVCIKIGETAFFINNNSLEYLRKYGGREVQIGVRPADFICSLEPQNVNDCISLQAAVIAFENVGGRIWLYLQLDEQTVMMETTDAVRAHIGDELTVYVRLSALHFFDAETGNTLV